jgi:hypothetical protein
MGDRHGTVILHGFLFFSNSLGSVLLELLSRKRLLFHMES